MILLEALCSLAMNECDFFLCDTLKYSQIMKGRSKQRKVKTMLYLNASFMTLLSQ